MTEARRALISDGCLARDELINHSTLPHVVVLIVRKYRATAPQGLTKDLMALTMLMQEANEDGAQSTHTEGTLLQEMEKCIARTVQQEMEKVSTVIKSTIADQCKAASPPESLLEAVTTLKQVAKEMGKSIVEANIATTQISDMALTYKEALLKTAS